MAISLTATGSKIDIVSTDVGGNTIDDIYVAVQATANPTYMVRTGEEVPYTYSIPAQVELEISTNCYIKDYTSGGGILQWSSRSAHSSSTFDLQTGAILELGGDWKIDFDTSDTYYGWIYVYGQLILQGTEGHYVELTHYYILYCYTMEDSGPWDWDWVKLSEMSYANGYFLCLIYNEVKPTHTFNNILIYDSGQGDSTARGHILFNSSDDFSGCVFDNFIIDGVNVGINSKGASFKFTNTTIKNVRNQALDIVGSGSAVPHYKCASDLTDRNKGVFQQPKVVFENCVFQDNYVVGGASRRAAGQCYQSVTLFKNCTFQGIDPITCLWGHMANFGDRSIYVGTTTFNRVTNERYWNANGSHYHAKTLILTVKDANGNNLEDANVVVKQASDWETSNFVSNSLGQVKDLFGDDPIFIEKEETSTEIYTQWSNDVETGLFHWIIISKPGFQTWEAKVEFDVDRTITATLVPVGGPRSFNIPIYS